MDKIFKELSATKNKEEQTAILTDYGINSQLSAQAAQVIRPCVILHWFNQEIIQALLPANMDDSSIKRIYKQLADFPHIETISKGLTFHSLARTGLINRYARISPDTLIDTAKRAAPVYASYKKDKSVLAEAFFCYIIAGEEEVAIELLADLLQWSAKHQDWQYFVDVLQMQQEAESMPFVRPLKRPFWLCLAWGMYHNSIGEHNKALEAFTQAVTLNSEDTITLRDQDIVPNTEDGTLEVILKVARAWLLLETRQDDLAQKMAQEVLNSPINNDQVRAASLVVLGTGLGYKAQYQEAEKHLLKGLDIYNKLNDDLIAGKGILDENGIAILEEIRPERYAILNTLGRFARQRGKIEEAFNYYNTSLKLSSEEKDQAWIASAMGSLAQLYRWQGQLQTAYDYAFKSLSIRQKLNNKAREAFSWNYLGMIYRDDGIYSKARKCFNTAIEQWEEVGAQWDKGVALQNLGWLSYEEEKYEEAESYYNSSRKILESHEMENELPNLYYKMGELYYTLGKLYNDLNKINLANQFFEKGLGLARKNDNQLFVANYLTSLSRIALDERNWEHLTNYESEIQELQRKDYNFYVAFSDMEFILGDSSMMKGKTDKAFNHYAKGYIHLGHHDERRFEKKLDYLRQKLIDLEPDQQERQAGRLIQIWELEEDLAVRYSYFIDMCRRLGVQN